jgi:putative heme-binding domain-containing protein
MAVRGISFLETPDATALALSVTNQPMDYWIEYTLEHTLHALEPQWSEAETRDDFLASSTERAKQYLLRHKRLTGPGGAAVVPLEIADDVNRPASERNQAVKQLAGIRGGRNERGRGVFKQVCSACHQVGELGKKFGPNLSDVGSRMSKEQIIRSVVMPNAEISKGYETVTVLTVEGDTLSGFVIERTDETLSLGVANGKRVDIPIEDIEIEQARKASSMPEGLVKQIAPIEFLDLVEFLSAQRGIRKVNENGWVRAEYRDAPELRTLDGAVEVSQDASIKLGDQFDHGTWNAAPHLALTATSRQDFDFAFHSNHDADSPAVMVRLSEPRELTHLLLRNRVNPQFHSRAQGLTVWISENGQDYRRVWTADEMKGKWVVELPEGTRGQYLKIGLDGKGTFHLDQIAVFGK